MPGTRSLPSLLVLLFLLLATACLSREATTDASSGPVAKNDTQAASVPVAPSPQAAEPADGAVKPAERALRIRTETTVAASDVEAALGALRKAVSDAGGYLADAKTMGQGHERWAEIDARIPRDRLAEFRAGLGNLGEVTSDHESAEDVTEQRADLGARLRNARAQEQRLLTLLGDRTGTLADVIAAEKALAEARETIERLEAQSKTLEGQIAYATVKIRLEPKRVIAEPGPLARIGEGAGRGVELAGEVAVGLVVLAATLGPTALMLAAVGLAIYAVLRRVLARRASRAAA
jgi:hypothetical protein